MFFFRIHQCFYLRSKTSKQSFSFFDAEFFFKLVNFFICALKLVSNPSLFLTLTFFSNLPIASFFSFSFNTGAGALSRITGSVSNLEGADLNCSLDCKSLGSKLIFGSSIQRQFYPINFLHSISYSESRAQSTVI